MLKGINGRDGCVEEAQEIKEQMSRKELPGEDKGRGCTEEAMGREGRKGVCVT